MNIIIIVLFTALVGYMPDNSLYKELHVHQCWAVGKTMMFAIKPGGFGDAHTWVRAWDRLVAT
jgi:hypothetical protein